MAQVVWTEPALNDLEVIADYIALDKPKAARRFVHRVFQKIELLGRFPLLGTKPVEIRDFPYRQLVVAPCRIFYRVAGKRIYIVSVLRGEKGSPKGIR
ncbi:MAG: type II toxin-antitoxin system RelE/ParE family toxin [Deltaproteobacteria bacterium]|nr:type II toxin-antitoxin system RelE/ParE family toxin [Deltaproteobacteria bacterium]